jgi:hypothetical protein
VAEPVVNGSRATISEDFKTDLPIARIGKDSASDHVLPRSAGLDPTALRGLNPKVVLSREPILFEIDSDSLWQGQRPKLLVDYRIGGAEAASENRLEDRSSLDDPQHIVGETRIPHLRGVEVGEKRAALHALRDARRRSVAESDHVDLDAELFSRAYRDPVLQAPDQELVSLLSVAVIPVVLSTVL